MRARQGRERQYWTLPVSPDVDRWCHLPTPHPMTGVEWEKLMELVTLYGRALVSPELSVAMALEGIAR